MPAKHLYHDRPEAVLVARFPAKGARLRRVIQTICLVPMATEVPSELGYWCYQFLIMIEVLEIVESFMIMKGCNVLCFINDVDTRDNDSFLVT